MRDQQRTVRVLQRDYDRLSRAAGGLVRRFFSLRGAIGALAGGGFLGLAIRNQTRYGATLAETSDRTGILVERLQLLQRVFEGDGAGAEVVNKALSFLLRTFSEAASGVKEYADEFEALGINAAAFARSGANQYELLKRVADGFSGLTSQADRARVAQAIFGRSGQLLLNVLQRGGAELEAAQERFRVFGLVSEREARDLKALEQALTNVGTVARVGMARGVAEASGELEGLAVSLIRRVPRGIEVTVRGVRWVVDNVGQLGRTARFVFLTYFGNRVFAGIASRFAVVTGSAITFRTALLGVAAAGRAIGRVFLVGFAIEGITRLIGNARALEERLEKVAETSGLARSRVDEIFEAVAEGSRRATQTGDLDRVFDFQLAAARSRGISAGELRRFLRYDQAIDTAADEFAEELERLGQELQRRLTGDDPLGLEAAGLDTSLDIDLGLNSGRLIRDIDEVEGRLGRLRSERFLDVGSLIRDVDQVEGALGRLGPGPLKPIRAEAEGFRFDVEANGYTIEEAGWSFERFTGRVLRDFSQIGRAARQLAADITGSLIRNVILDPALQVLSTGLRARLGIPEVGGGNAAGGTALGLRRVNERGGEVFDFKSPARVLPAELLRSLPGLAPGVRGGLDFRQEFNFYGAEPEGVRAILDRELPGLEERATAGVIDRLQREGIL